MKEIDIDLNIDNISKYIEELGQCGIDPEGGLYRPVYSAGWVEAGKKLFEIINELKLEAKEDSVGNIFARLNGSNSNVILTGSHIDTVKRGGKYDGAIGIISGLIAVDSLRKMYGKPKKSIEVIATCQEESSRFSGNFWGTRAVLGLISEGEADKIIDQEKISIGQAMINCGFAPQKTMKSRRSDIEAFIELHIEQGAILESEGYQVGIVSDITGITHLAVTVKGRSDHAGTTPMDMRKDSLLGFAKMAVEIQQIASEMGRPAVATVGFAKIIPGAVNVVAGLVEFQIDIRHPGLDKRSKLTKEIEKICHKIGEQLDLKVSIEKILDIPGNKLNNDIISIMEDSAKEHNIPYKIIVSSAGHDAQMFAKSIPSAMIFVASVDGRSHCPEEYSKLEDIVVATKLLTATLYKLAY